MILQKGQDKGIIRQDVLSWLLYFFPKFQLFILYKYKKGLQMQFLSPNLLFSYRDER